MRSTFLGAVAATALLAAASSSAFAAPVLWSGNNHYYEFVTARVNWTDALALSATNNYLGSQGYLATITSDPENAFLLGLTALDGWIAGSDAAVEGQWRWMAGPEATTLFYTGVCCTGIPTGYANWAAGEPNNFANEDYATLRWLPAGVTTQWNDLPNDNYGAGLGYFVEYDAPAAVPEPSAWAILVLGFGGVGAMLRSRWKRAPARV